VDVPDLLVELSVRVNVPIVPASTLPEPVRASCIPEPIKNRRIELNPACNDPLRQTKLECLQDVAHNPIVGLSHKQMRVIGHKNPRIEQKIVPLTRDTKLINERIPDCSRAEQVEALIR
jgi:hypothetical protein